MFNLKNFKLVNRLKNIKLKSDWIKFSNINTSSNSRNEFLNSIIEDNKFIEEELKMRKMVEDMLVKEFSADIKNNKSYNFIVDSVLNKLKLQQMGNIDPLEDVI